MNYLSYLDADILTQLLLHIDDQSLISFTQTAHLSELDKVLARDEFWYRRLQAVYGMDITLPNTGRVTLVSPTWHHLYLELRRVWRNTRTREFETTLHLNLQLAMRFLMDKQDRLHVGDTSCTHQHHTVTVLNHPRHIHNAGYHFGLADIEGELIPESSIRCGSICDDCEVCAGIIGQMVPTSGQTLSYVRDLGGVSDLTAMRSQFMCGTPGINRNIAQRLGQPLIELYVKGLAVQGSNSIYSVLQYSEQPPEYYIPYAIVSDNCKVVAECLARHPLASPWTPLLLIKEAVVRKKGMLLTYLYKLNPHPDQVEDRMAWMREFNTIVAIAKGYAREDNGSTYYSLRQQQEKWKSK